METNPYNNHFRKRYQILNLIARGYFGKVYRVKDTKQQVIKAEKISINPINPKDKQKLTQWCQLIVKLNNKTIIKGYEYIMQSKMEQMNKGLKRQYLHIIMEYFEGKQLKEYMGKLTQAQVVKIYKQLKSAIIYLKKQNIVHRDISLDNILVDENMNIKLTDFGIANDLKGEKYYFTEKCMGKDSYRAPEVWKKNVSINSDLWALGIIVLELYFGAKIIKLYKSKPGDREQFPSEFYQMKKGKISQEIMKIVEPLLQRDHNKRKFYVGDEQDENDQDEDKVIVFKNIKTNQKITKMMTKLYLGSKQIRTEQVIKIAKNLKNLTDLWLNSNNIGTEGAVEIAKNLKNLTRLSLLSSSIGTEAAVEIAKNLKNLAYLDLMGSSIGIQGAVKIAKNLKNLISLRLNSNNIGTEGALEIANNLTNLTQLDLGYNKIGTEAAVVIAKNLNNLTLLSLNNNNIGTQGAVEIALNLKKLAYLNLCNNNIGMEGAVQIAKNLKKLTQLVLTFNNIGTEGAIQIANNLKNLTLLSLDGNNIGTEGAVEIASNLKKLTYLNLCNNNIGTNGAVEIAINLKNLTWLSLYENNIDQQAKNTVRSMMKDLLVFL